MVADGVGGAAAGEEASRLAVGAITRYVTQAIHCYYSEDAMDEQRFPRALESAALRVHEDIQRNSPTGPLQAYMATTLNTVDWRVAARVSAPGGRQPLLPASERRA